MIIKLRNKITLFFLIVTFFSSCISYMKKEDWQNLKDRNFYLTDLGILTSDGKEVPFYGSTELDFPKAMEKGILKIPLKDIINAMEKKYNISINYSGLNEVIKKKSFKLDSGFSHTWELGEERKNKFSLYFFIDSKVYTTDKLTNVNLGVFSAISAWTSDYAIKVIPKFNVHFETAKGKTIESFPFATDEQALFVKANKSKKKKIEDRIRKYYMDYVFSTFILESLKKGPEKIY